MVRLPDAKDRATCQFFINVADNPDLDHKDETSEGYGYCVFGEVLDGMATVEMPSAVPKSVTRLSLIARPSRRWLSRASDDFADARVCRGGELLISILRSPILLT